MNPAEPIWLAFISPKGTINIEVRKAGKNGFLGSFEPEDWSEVNPRFLVVGKRMLSESRAQFRTVEWTRPERKKPAIVVQEQGDELRVKIAEFKLQDWFFCHFFWLRSDDESKKEKPARIFQSFLNSHSVKSSLSKNFDLLKTCLLYTSPSPRD